MIDAKVHVKCLGGREIVGVLKGYDELVNLVLDDADEYIRGKPALLYVCCIVDYVTDEYLCNRSRGSFHNHRPNSKTWISRC
jgi:small nuclear ribonucleoprotein (snRNP)-like protein